jgi:hypothetical protein
MLSRFDPVKLSFQDIAPVACPTTSSPNSMAVDMNGVAWAGYHSGELFRIDLTNATCQATSFVVGQHEMKQFGMEFLFDPPTSTESLYLAGGSSITNLASTLATVDMSSLVLTPVGLIQVGFIEPGATPDGQLWGFAPRFSSVSGFPTLARIDPTNGNTLTSKSYSEIGADGAFAMKFFQGGFFIFDGPAIYRVDLGTLALTTEIDATHHPEVMQRPDGSLRSILGAGYSRCPPPS